ncbi:MAG: AmmeMemoRadiSam system protein A [Dehalococcoidia bacterium]|nr:AmmeMemoRadiSam system protein A [Dehalococcoidia bacterium]
MAKQRHPMVELARKAVEKYIRYGKVFRPRKLTAEMKSKAGVFVSIKKHGELRGCIGTFLPTRANVAGEVVANAINSATQDPRFMPVGVSELDDLEYSVDVLAGPETVRSVDQLDPKRYGVIVECGFRRGLLLPDLEGVDTVDEQIGICKAKAGISAGEPIKLYRFQVKRFN